MIAQTKVDSKLNDILIRRGIDTVATDADWMVDGQGWHYPVSDLERNTLAKRWKRGAGQGAKYFWKTTNRNAKYYFGAYPEKFLQSIADNGDLVYIVNGEPSVLAMNAAGIVNAFSWFGEGSIPATLADDLQSWGVTEVRYLADHDDAGRKSAVKVRDKLAETDIVFNPLTWGDVADSYDANDQWMDCGFDSADFTSYLAELDALILPRETRHSEIKIDWSSDKIPADLVSAVRAALGLSTSERTNSDGWTKRRVANPVDSHEHDDRNPGSSFNMKTGVLKDFKGRNIGPYELAVHFGIETRDYRIGRRSQADVAYDTYTHQHQTVPVYVDIVFDTEFVNQYSDLPAHGVVCLIADKGTGKTEWAKDTVDFYRRTLDDTRVCVVTPFITLTQAASERYDIENYQALNRVQQAQVSSIAITLNSLENFATGGTIPRYDVLVLDELSKILIALGSRRLFRDGQATRVYSVLKHIIERAELVLVTDADLSAVEIDWLKSIRTDVQVCMNTRRRDFGPMTVIDTDNSDAIDTALFNAIGDNQGPVFAVSDEKARVEAWRNEAARIYGADNVLAIHSENSTNNEQREFIKNPTTRLECYRVVFASPSALTGLDIQSQVYHTFGAFGNHDVDAGGCLQLLARARNTGQTTIWVKAKDRKQPTDPDTIYQRARQAARGSEILCALDSDGQLDFDGVRQELNKLQAQVKAHHFRSLNDLHGILIAQARRNYTVTVVDENLAEDMAMPMKEARQRVRERRDDLRLTAVPISPEVHQKLSGKGIRTEADNAGLYRWQVENLYKQDISPDLMTFDQNGKGRAYLQTFIEALRTTESDLRDLDTKQIQDHTPDQMRDNHARRQRTLRRFILAGWGSRNNFNPDQVRSQDDWIARFEPFFEQWGGAIYLYCGGRNDHIDNPWRAAQRLLRLLGLNFEDTRTPDENGQKQYRLGREKWRLLNDLADTRIAGLKCERSLKEESTWEGLQKSVVKESYMHEAPLNSTQNELLAGMIPHTPVMPVKVS